MSSVNVTIWICKIGKYWFRSFYTVLYRAKRKIINVPNMNKTCSLPKMYKDSSYRQLAKEKKGSIINLKVRSLLKRDKKFRVLQ